VSASRLVRVSRDTLEAVLKSSSENQVIVGSVPEGEVESSRYLPVKTRRSGRSLADPVFHTARLIPCSTNRR